MIWKEPALIIIFTSSLTIALLFMRLYFTNDRPMFLLAWTLSWLTYCAGFTCLICGISIENYKIVFITAAEILAMINCYMLLYGTHVYYKIRFELFWPVFFTLICSWILLQSAGTDSIIKTLPPALFFFTAYLYSGFLFITAKHSPRLERTIAGILLLLWGSERLYIAFNWMSESKPVYGIIIGATLNIMISLFIILTYLQDTRRHFVLEKQRAEESDRLKSTFLANMSHEIRTPLNAILGFAQLLNKTDIPPGDKDIFINNIKNSGEKLLSLIDDVLDISKIEAGSIKIFPSVISVNRLIDDIVSLFSLSKSISNKNLSLTAEKDLADGDDSILTDETRLFQILSNLINNAIKFTEKGTIVTGYKMAAPGYIQFYVKDTGIGISEDAVQKIFTPFFQEGKMHAAGGTGLGLPIVKGLVESLGGKIHIKSIENQGTEISFTLPCKKIESSKPVRPLNKLSETNDITGKKILLVEDDPINRKVIEKFLEPSGTILISTESGAESVRLCRDDDKIDIILMDLILPDMDGYSAMREIKKIRPDLPVIVQSANSMPEHRDRAKKSGADGFIAKPIKKEELYSSIRNHLSAVRED